jgi:hypothetical protein
VTNNIIDSSLGAITENIEALLAVDNAVAKIYELLTSR